MYQLLVCVRLHCAGSHVTTLIADSDSDDEEHARAVKHLQRHSPRPSAAVGAAIEVTAPAAAAESDAAGDDVVDGVMSSPTPVVLDASKLKPREKKPLVSFISVDKPSTPKTARKQVRRPPPPAPRPAPPR